jgi:hypothetical protein
MPGRGRVIAPSYPHHIVQRGHNRQAVFLTEGDRSAYLATLCEFREKLSVACARYIDLNSVRAGMVKRPEDYAWSSYRARTELDDCPWLDSDLALAPTIEQRQQRYREFVMQGIPGGQLELLRTAVPRNQLTGSDVFILEIEQLTGMRILNRHPPLRQHSPARKPTIKESE